jgi:hypothetical protein
MKKHVIAAALCAAALDYSATAGADDRLVRFDGGIGVVPVSAVSAPNTVLGVLPGGQPWVISRLTADVRSDGHITVDGRGLLFAGGNAIGTNGNQVVHAVLFCGGVASSSDAVPLQANGDFSIDSALDPMPPDPCASPVLLIVNAGGRWFAAGIPKLP